MIAKIVLNSDLALTKINRHIYGHFSEHLGRCVYDGFWVGEDSSIPNLKGIRTDVVEALKAIKIPNLRWPGGCFADDYHWQDGIGPRAMRPSTINTYWGGVTDNNHFGTHEFMELCEQLGCEPYISGNVGSGTVREMSQWIEYLTSEGDTPLAVLRRKHGRQKPWNVPFWGIGNENWGFCGNMRPEYYADLLRHYASYCRNYGTNQLFKIACGPGEDNYEWTEILMSRAARFMDGLSLHYYTGIYSGSWDNRKPATDFDAAGWDQFLLNATKMNELIVRHSAIMDKYDPGKRVALVVDEWGTWHAVEPGTNKGFLYQQNTLRDALAAGLTLNIFNRHADRIRMANIAQTVNVLQAMILTEGEKMLLTPSYHVFEMFKGHQDALLIPMDITSPEIAAGNEKMDQLSASASRSESGSILLTLCNLSLTEAVETVCEFRGSFPSNAKVRVLTDSDSHAHNTFEDPGVVKPIIYDGVRLKGSDLTLEVPPKSVLAVELA